MSIFEAMVLEGELDAMRLRAEAAEAELAALRVPCVWVYDLGTYQSGCNKSVWWGETFDFCPYCGHLVQVQS